ncbi:glycosyltransferase family 2 protein [Stutzerimonas stutzeri]|uniref:glycosyltransferase family 2 protein n=1 Tax=Stutzerimonas stutzeri TaxID=316 RepID=UPI002552AB0E|nr:glycosyltransferase family 2 protein [Stutzerimonas stutzeri]
MNPMLAICIPTYNRVAYLSVLLDSILSQVTSDISCKIEICISDNASEDRTAEVVHAYSNQAICPIRYSKNALNLGFDRNVLAVVGLASADYCWIVGSDDLVAPGSIERLLSIISRVAPPDLLLFPRQDFFDVSSPGRIVHWLSTSGVDKGYFDFSRPDDFKEYLKCASGLGAGFSYIGSAVFKREEWLAIDSVENVLGSCYVHAFVIASMCLKGAKLVYLNDALILCRLGNDGFATSGRLLRVKLDFDAYLSFSRLLPLSADLSKLYLNMLRKEHNYFNLFKHMCHPASIKDRYQLCRCLVDFGFGKVVYFIAALGGFSSFILGAVKRLFPRESQICRF